MPQLRRFSQQFLSPAAALALIAGSACSPAIAQQDAGKPPPAVAEDPTKTTNYKAPAGASPTDNSPDPETPSYLIGAFVIRYAVEHPQFPALDDLMKAPVTLGVVDGGYAKPSPDVRKATYTIEELCGQPPQRYTTFAVFAVQQAVKKALEKDGIFATLVTLSDQEFVPNDARKEGQPQYLDQRPKGSTAVTLIVRTGVVGEARTIAFGERIPYEERINNPKHENIIKNSPVQVFNPDDPRREDLLRKDKLDDYVFKLNRHAGRRVDLALAAGDREGELALDYLVNETKPWTLYGQVSNTGTKETNEWRERFGFTHNQLTGADDILNLDYVTAGFEDSHFFGANYERPIWGDWLRARVFGNANEFTASDVGATGEQFKGDGWTFGGELVANVLQRHAFFLDAYAGARYQHIKTTDDVTGTTGDDDFFLPDIGVRFERFTDTNNLNGDLGFEFNLPDVAGTSSDLSSLQRQNADNDWVAFHGAIAYATYLDQFFAPKGEGATLAHEVAFAVRGQYAFGYRLIPNFEEVVGGMYTVRGYPESVAAGDSAIVANLEYRFHLPQALGLEASPGTLFGQSFRYRPQVPYGRADWDLILKGFLDAGRTVLNDRTGTENNETLIGTGVGVEFIFKRNFNVRVDWGVALEEIENQVSSGSNRFHISATILF